MGNMKIFKRILCMIIVSLVSVSFAGCDNKKSAEDDVQPNLDTAYDTAYIKIVEAKEETDKLLTLLLKYWEYSGFESFYDYDDVVSFYSEHPNSNNGFWEDAKKSFEYRENIEKNLNSVLTILKDKVPNEETQQYYDSVKQLYLQTNAYYRFATEYPAGYSNEAYILSASDYKAGYEKQKCEVEFYK